MKYHDTRAWIRAEAKMYRRDQDAGRKYWRQTIKEAREVFGREDFDAMTAKQQARAAIEFESRRARD